MTLKIETKNKEKEKMKFAIVYFSDKGFTVFLTNIFDKKLLINLEHYPTLIGIMQNQDPSGLTTIKVDDNNFLYTYIINLKNPEARDPRLKKDTMTVINFLVNKETNRKIILFYDEFEKFLDDFFYPVVFLDDLYAIDFSNLISKFLNIAYNQTEINNSLLEISEEAVISKRNNRKLSLAVEFNKWIEENHQIK
ncbi:MAG: hypothetical protein ACTSVB_06810 [Candidatus Heimdallarchaeaceae archaeon]|uniref:Uncharacterized protein n=1 Tax=Candidatus Heimdallarchaeum endolithica TaxID=2876572 RepID=A0A9Y1BTU5_9ARCH|nr:MAG: hypothetical protein K9W46_06945 [Candidatus Heimdallarchaeum endolithica]